MKSMHKIKIKPLFIVYTTVTIVFILFHIFKYDLRIYAKETTFGLEVILGLSYYFINVLYVIFVIAAFSYAIARLKTYKWKSFIPVLIGLVVLFSFFILPTTNLYVQWNFDVYRNKRTDIIEMVRNGTITEYIDLHEWKVPYRQTSYTGTMLVQKQGDVLKILFYVYCGLTITQVLVYASDDSGIDAIDFSYGMIPTGNLAFNNINRIDGNWYSATIRP